MAGAFSACNPDRPGIWLCRQPGAGRCDTPDWLTGYEADTLSKLGPVRQQEYRTSRWLIRQALGCASGLSPDQCQPVDGRPVASVLPPGWRLSLSHSKGLAAVAAGRDRLGIDIEPHERRANWRGVVRRWFTPAEQAWLLAADDPLSFLRVWTLKEAWLKATERGIAGNLQTLEVLPGFELFGDQADGGWHATSFLIESFIVTLVYRSTVSTNPDATPELTMLMPPEDFQLVPARARTTRCERLLQTVIHCKP